MSYGTVCGVEGPGFAEATTLLFNDAFSTPITGADPTMLDRHLGALRLLTKNAMLAAMGKVSGGI
nr:hypothetical protein [Pyrinomonadaceae bacterium]